MYSAPARGLMPMNGPLEELGLIVLSRTGMTDLSSFAAAVNIYRLPYLSTCKIHHAVFGASGSELSGTASILVKARLLLEA